jgi:hypothetical protein
LTAAEENIRRASALLASRDYTTAYAHAQRAMRPLRMLERAHWEAAVASIGSPVTSPAAVSFATLPWHGKLMHEIARTRPEPNVLIGGDFEDLGTMLQTGWQHFQRPPPGVYAGAELATAAAHSGRYGLRLTARAAKDDQPQGLVESPPCYMRTAAVPVEAGQWVCIRGWVQVRGPITGSVDGLLIVDSLSGEALAERIHETNGWQPFTLYRTAVERGQLSVTLALSGLGEAWVDDVTIQVIPLPGSGTRNPDVARVPGNSRP